MYDTPKPRYRRNLPHWQPPGASIFLTFNLDGSLPRVARERLTATRALLERETARAAEDQGQRRARHNKKLFAVLESGSRADRGLVRVEIQRRLLMLDFQDTARRVGLCCSEGFVRVRYRWMQHRFIESGVRQRGKLLLTDSPLHGVSGRH